MARPRKPNPGGGLVGAILGGLVGGPWGAVAGGTIGVAGTGEKLPLEEALRTSLAQPPLSLSLVNLKWTSKFSLNALVQDPKDGGFWVFHATVPVKMDLTAEQLEDALYDSALVEALEWRLARGISA